MRASSASSALFSSRIGIQREGRDGRAAPGPEQPLGRAERDRLCCTSVGPVCPRGCRYRRSAARLLQPVYRTSAPKVRSAKRARSRHPALSDTAELQTRSWTRQTRSTGRRARLASRTTGFDLVRYLRPGPFRERRQGQPHKSPRVRRAPVRGGPAGPVVHRLCRIGTVRLCPAGGRRRAGGACRRVRALKAESEDRGASAARTPDWESTPPRISAQTSAVRRGIERTTPWRGPAAWRRRRCRPNRSTRPARG